MWLKNKRITNVWKYMQRGLAENGYYDGQPKARREVVHLLPLSAHPASSFPELALKENWRRHSFSWVHSFERCTLARTQTRSCLLHQPVNIHLKMATPQLSNDGCRDSVSTKNRVLERQDKWSEDGCDNWSVKLNCIKTKHHQQARDNSIN